uniref:Uncharacterized protein n=1 Tax=viral metagenome TaxID=1070528 RepID=A0A6C0J6B3_9ZZZZ
MIDVMLYAIEFLSNIMYIIWMKLKQLVKVKLKITVE